MADGEVGHVLRAALATAVAAGLAEELGHEPVRIATLGEQMAVAAVRADHPIVGAQRQARADGDRFLADVGMRRAADAAVAHQREHALLEGADEHQQIE